MIDETLWQLSEDRYGSCFSALANPEADATSRLTLKTQQIASRLPYRAGKDRQSIDTVTRRPTPNEVRKRTSEGNGKDGDE